MAQEIEIEIGLGTRTVISESGLRIGGTGSSHYAIGEPETICQVLAETCEKLVGERNDARWLLALLKSRLTREQLTAVTAAAEAEGLKL